MKKWMTLGLLSAAMFIIVIDTTIMNVSISALVEDLDTTVGGIQAAISLYALVMASFMLVGGKLGDIIGPRRTFTLGLVIFGFGTTIASFSQNLATLLVGWSVLEGIGSALMMPNIQTLLRGRYDGADRALSYGIISAVGAVGAALGPIIGGYLTTFHSWRWAFRFEVVVVVAVLLLSGNIAKDRLPATRPKFDFVGAVLSAVGFAAVVLGVLLIGDYGLWTAKKPFVIGSVEIAPFGLSIVPFLIGAGLLVLGFLMNYEKGREERDDPGLFQPSLLRTPGLLAGLNVRLIQMAITAGALFLIPLFLQLTFDYTAMETGVALLPLSIGVLVFAIGGARLSSRFQAKRIIQVGFAGAIVGLVVMAAAVRPDVSTSELATGALLGAGIGLIASQILNLVLSRVGEADTPEVAGINGTFEQLGNALGVALIGTVMVVSLSSGMQSRIDESTVIPDDQKADLTAAVDEGIELVSDQQVTEALDSADAEPQVRDEVVEVYSVERTEAFRAGIAFLVFVAFIGLLGTQRLPPGRLVEPTATAEPVVDRRTVGGADPT